LVRGCLQPCARLQPADQGARQCGYATHLHHPSTRWKINHNFNTYLHDKATKAEPFLTKEPFPGGKLQADILLSGITTIDKPAGRNWYLDVTSTNPMGVTNHESFASMTH
jgi:hypothetical protein